MKVPDVEQTESFQTGTSVPEAQVPHPLEAAFGANVYEAQAGVGQAVSGMGKMLADHLIEREKWQGEASAFDNVAGLKEFAQQRMFNEDGTGWLQKKGLDANGVYADAKTQLRDEYNKRLNNIPVPNRASYGRFAQSAMDGVLEHINQHEATEVRNGINNSIITDRNTLISSAVGITSPEQLNEVTKQALEHNAKVDEHNGVETGTQEFHDKSAYKVTLKAMTGAVVNNVGDDGAAAQKLLDGNDYLDENTKLDLQTQLEHLVKQANDNQKTALQKDIIKNDGPFLDRIASGDPSQLPSKEEVKQMDDNRIAHRPGGISVQASKIYWNSFKATPLTEDEKTAKADDLHQSLLAITKSDEKTLDPNAKFENVSTYLANLADMRHNGLISPMKYEESKGLVGKIYDKGLTDAVNVGYKNTTSMSNFLTNFARTFTQSPTLGAFVGNAAHTVMGDKTGENLSENSQEFKDAKVYLNQKLMDRLVKGGIKQEDEPLLMQSILRDFIVKHHDGMMGTEGLPNAIAKNGSFSHLYLGKSPYKPDISVGNEASENTKLYNGIPYTRDDKGIWHKNK